MATEKKKMTLIMVQSLRLTVERSQKRLDEIVKGMTPQQLALHKERGRKYVIERDRRRAKIIAGLPPVPPHRREACERVRMWKEEKAIRQNKQIEEREIQKNKQIRRIQIQKKIDEDKFYKLHLLDFGGQGWGLNKHSSGN